MSKNGASERWGNEYHTNLIVFSLLFIEFHFNCKTSSRFGISIKYLFWSPNPIQFLTVFQSSLGFVTFDPVAFPLNHMGWCRNSEPVTILKVKVVSVLLLSAFKWIMLTSFLWVVLIKALPYRGMWPVIYSTDHETSCCYHNISSCKILILPW